MQIERSNRPTEAPLVADILPVSFSTEQPRDTLVASSTPKRGGGIGAWVKAVLTKIYNAIFELFSFCAIEPSKLEIIEEMFSPYKGQAKEFAKNFQENLNACIQAAFYDPEKVTKLLDKNKGVYKDFCKKLNKELRAESLMGKLQDQKAAVITAIRLMWEDVTQDNLKGGVDQFKHNIPTLGKVIISFCNEIKFILESSRGCDENLRPQLQALKNLVSNYIPDIAREMTKQPSAFTKFVTDLINIRDFKADTIIKHLTDNRIIRELTKKQDHEDIRACFGKQVGILNMLSLEDDAPKYGIKPHINYTTTFLQAITVEQFEILLPALIPKDLNADLRKGVVDLFRQIKNTEEPISEKRLKNALDCLQDLYNSFEDYHHVDERDRR